MDYRYGSHTVYQIEYHWARSRFPGHRLEPVDTASCPPWGLLHGRFPILPRIALTSPYARCTREHRQALAVVDLSAKDHGCPVATNQVIQDLRAGDLAMIVGGCPWPQRRQRAGK